MTDGLMVSFVVCFDSSCPSQQFFSHVGAGLPGLNKFLAANKVSCSRTQHSDSTSGETPVNLQSNTLPTRPLCSAQLCCQKAHKKQRFVLIFSSNPTIHDNELSENTCKKKSPTCSILTASM